MANLKTTTIDGSLIEKSGGAPPAATIDRSAILFSGSSEYVGDNSSQNAIHSAPYIAYDPNTPNKFVAIYADQAASYHGKAIVGTVSISTISYGAEQTFNAGTTAHMCIAMDPNTANKFVVAYKNSADNQKGYAIVGTISGTTISWGTPAIFNNSFTMPDTIIFDQKTAGSFVIIWADHQSTTYGVAIVGSVSGTSLTFGSKQTFASAATGGGTGGACRAAFDPNRAGKFIVVFRDNANSNKGTTIVGDVTGSPPIAITWGTEAVFHGLTGSTVWMGISWDPNRDKRFAITYTSPDDSNEGSVISGELSGGSLNAVSGLNQNVGTFHGNNIQALYTGIAFDPNKIDTAVVIWAVYDGSDSISGKATEVTFGAGLGDMSFPVGESEFTDESTYYHNIVMDPNSPSKFIVAYGDSDPSPARGGRHKVGRMEESQVTIDLALGNFFELNLQNLGAATYSYVTLIINNPHASKVSTFKLKIIQGSTSTDFDYGYTIKWPGGTIPTLTTTDNAVDVLQFTTWDAGSSWYGRVVGQNFS